jgi:iron-sulfur cluster assembly protein
MIPKSIDDLNTCSFSTVAAAQEQEEESLSPKKPTKTKSRGGRTTKRKDPLIIKPAAAARIKELLSSSNGEDAIGIRLGVKRRGCNGLSYTMNYAFEKEPNEEEMEAYGVRVMIEPMALFSVVGTEMDWVETDMTSEFTFRNPNSKGECGCGESFNV